MAKRESKETTTGSRARFEYSSGGIVRDRDKVLLVKVENMEGQKTWTFPKGHIEKDESVEDAAVREVEEETGYRCRILKPFERVQYWFKHKEQLIKKTVTWFLMEPVEKTGVPDTAEVLDATWMTVDEALAVARYKSDKHLLAKLKKNG